MAAVIERMPIVVDLDRGADVLYISLGMPQDDEGEDRPNGLPLSVSKGEEAAACVVLVQSRPA